MKKLLIMKKLFTLFAMLLLTVCLFAQAPQKMNYQAVVRNANNSLVANQNVSARISILQGSSTGAAVYSETHNVQTNANGLLTLEIGGGSAVTGSFDQIDWANGPYFIKSEIDPEGGINYSVTTTQQLMSVPYALYAENAGNSFSGKYEDLTGKPEIPSVPTQVSAFANDKGYLTAETDPTIPAWAKETTKPAYDYSEIKNTPKLFDGDYNSLSNKPALFDGNYNNLTNKPNLFDGDYNNLANKPELFDGDYNSLTNKPTIPTVPANVSAFTNDKGYLTTETDPTIPAWAKEATKPAYDYSEIKNTPELFDGDYNSLSNKPALFDGNYNNLTNKPNFFDGDYNSLTNKPTIPTVPTNVSAFTNDAGYITQANVQEAANVPTKVSAFENDANYITKESIPTQVSAFANDKGYLTTETDPTIYAWAKEATKPAYDYSEIKNTPKLFDGDYNSLSNKPALFDGNYNNLTNKPNLFDGDYNNLTNKPELFDGDYNSLTNKPTIPAAANDATLTIQKNGTSVGTFTANSSSNKNINITVPTSTSELANNSGFVSNSNCPTVDLCDLYNTVSSLQDVVSSLQNTVAVQQHIIDSLLNKSPLYMVPSVITKNVISVTDSSAVCGGNVIDDGGLDVLTRGICWSTTINPTIEGNHIVLGNGIGQFSDTLFDLSSGTTYYIRAYAVNSEGVGYGENVNFTTNSTELPGSDPHEALPCEGTPAVTDYDGNTYNTVQIGEQCWMAENMRATKYDDGTSISSGLAKYDDPAMGSLVYYSWAVATRNSTNSDVHNNKVQGICPKGWHVPCYDDWNTLCKTVDPAYQEVTSRGSNTLERTSSNGLAIKLCAPIAWPASATPNTPGYCSTDATGFNTTGFSALPIGYALNDGTVSAPGSCHLWASSKGTSQGDIFKFTAPTTGVTWQWNMNNKTYCGVRCVMDSENGEGGGGEIDNPDDTLSLDGKYVIFSEQSTRSYQIYDITDPSKPVWQWSAQKDGGYTTFNNPSDVKPVYNGTCFMAVASGGGAVIVRIKDKKVLFYANPAGNPHSIELLPNNRVVVASSTGNKLTVYDIDTTRNMRTPATAVYTMTFDCGHNVVWDEGRKCLWSAGQSYVEKIAYNEATGALTTIEKYEFPEGNTYAHDFIKIYGQDLYHMSTEQHTYIFDPKDNSFTLCETPASVNVKSISSGPEDYPTICAIPMVGYGTNSRTWVTNKVLDFNTGKSLMEIPGAEIYKLRWWIWEK